MNMKTCKTCKHLFEHRCHANPPMAVDGLHIAFDYEPFGSSQIPTEELNFVGVWPAVSDDAFCGRHESEDE